MAHAMMRSTAVAALLSLSLTFGAAHAQQLPGAEAPQRPATAAEGAAGQQAASGGGAQGTDAQDDALLATVGDAEIRGSDVMSVIGMLPPRLQSQMPQMLVPMALDQLILRELVLEEARGDNLAADPEVVALSGPAAREAEEDAMVQVWLDRQIAGAVTDEAVREVHDRLQSHGSAAVPPLAQLRPQIEQHLRRQAMQDVRDELRRKAEIVFYGPDGEAIAQRQDASGDGASDGRPPAGSAAADATGAAPAAAAEGGMPAAEDVAEGGTENREGDPATMGGWIGVQIQDVTPQIARALGYEDQEGALIAAVEPGSPAAEAGIVPGLIVVAVQDAQINSPLDLVSAISEFEEGREVTLTLRTGAADTEQVSVTIGQRPSLDEVQATSVQPEDDRPRLGIAVSPISPEAREEFGLPADLEGLVISRVEEGSPAARAEIAQGDVILAVDRLPISDVESLRNAAARARDEERPLLLRLYKDGAYSYVPVDLGEG